LPKVDEMISQFNEAGYQDVEAIRLIPGDTFFAFKAGKA
jgi:4-hydroxy-2,2'-bipyrrole-5-carbaldehyde O-methyltransferase